MIRILLQLIYALIYEKWIDLGEICIDQCKTSTIVFYRTQVYRMQPRNGQNS